MTYSPLVDVIIPSPFYGQRNHAIDTISIHCMACDATVESCGYEFQKPNKKASSNYGVGSDGRRAGYVPEEYASWCTSDNANDRRAITIEVACEPKHPYKVTDEALASLIELLVDICQRNDIPKLLWQGDKSLVGQVDKQNMTVHRWFAAKACPGDYLYNLHGEIAQSVNERLEEWNMKRYNTLEDMPYWAKPTIKKLIDKGYLSGNGGSLDLSEDMVRMFVINDRAGVYRE